MHMHHLYLSRIACAVYRALDWQTGYRVQLLLTLLSQIISNLRMY